MKISLRNWNKFTDELFEKSPSMSNQFMLNAKGLRGGGGGAKKATGGCFIIAE